MEDFTQGFTPPPSLAEQLPGHLLYLMDTIAGGSNQARTIDDAFNNAHQGIDSATQDQNALAEAVAQHVQKVTPQLAQSLQNTAPVHSGYAGQNPGDQIGPNGMYTNNPMDQGQAAQSPPSPDQVTGPGSLPQASDTQYTGSDLINQANKEYADQVAANQQIANQQPQLPAVPQQQEPTWLQGAMGALGALMNPQFAFDAAAAPFKAQAASADADYKISQQQYQLRNQAWQQRMQNADRLLSLAQNHQSHMMTIQQHILQMQQEGDIHHGTQVQTALQSYSLHPSPETAANLNRVLTRPEEQGMKVDDSRLYADMSLRNHGEAVQEFQRVYSGIAKYGQITDENAKQLIAARLKIGIAKGIVNPNDPIEKQQEDAAGLGAIVTDSSYRSQQIDAERTKIANQVAQFGATIDFNKDKWADDLAMKRANLALAQKKLADFEQWRSTSLAQSQSRIDIERESLSLREQATQAGVDVRSTTLAKIRKLETVDLPGAMSTLNRIRTDPEDPTIALNPKEQTALTSALNSVAKFKGQIGGLKLSLEPTIQMPSLMGGMTVPNPSYQEEPTNVKGQPDNGYKAFNPLQGPIGPGKATKQKVMSGKTKSGISFTFTPK